MRLIAHRGLYTGPDVHRENHPEQIMLALSEGFDVELDLRLVDGNLMLGHDEPSYMVSGSFLKQAGLWVHCKNVEALEYLCGSDIHFFWHDRDAYTLTSRGVVWTYPRQPLIQRSVWVQPEWDEDWRDQISDADAIYGICSKYVKEIRDFLAEKR